MAYTSPMTAVVGATFTAAQFNTNVRDNLTAIWVGTTAGDMEYYTSATAKSRLAIGTEYQFWLVNPGATAPQWGGLQWCSAYCNTTQDITTGSATALSFNGDVELNTTGWHDNATNNTRITVSKTGFYKASWNFEYAGSGGSGYYEDEITVKLNGSTNIARTRNMFEVGALYKSFCSETPIFGMSATEYVELLLEQNSGGTRTVQSWARFTLTRWG